MKLFNIVVGLTGKKRSNPLPEGITDSQLAADFATFFFKKIDKIRSDLENYPMFVPPTMDPAGFSQFTAINSDIVAKLAMKSKPATCDLDPLPTHLVKMYVDILSSVLCKIINTSFVEGVFPTSWKRAIVKPLLKKPSLEHIMKNYRPVSSLSFLAKLVEKASLISFQQHIEGNNLLPSY